MNRRNCIYVEDNDMTIDINKIKLLSTSRSPLVRCEVAEMLAECAGNECENILLSLLHDKNMLVRVEAADSLSSYASSTVFHSLLRVIDTETYYLLRGYAILSLSQVGLKIDPIRTVDELRNILQYEKRCFVKLSCHEGLYRLGIHDSLLSIFSLFKSKNYRNRCAVLSSLEQLMDNNNQIVILHFLREQLKHETDLSVKDHISKLIKKIEDSQ